MFKYSVVDPDQHGSALVLIGRIRILDPGGSKMGQKYKKCRNFMFWSAGCSVLRVEGFSCSLDVLHGGLRINKLRFLVNENIVVFQLCNSYIFYHQNFGSETGSALTKMLDPDHTETMKCRSTTLVKIGRFLPPQMVYCKYTVYTSV